MNILDLCSDWISNRSAAYLCRENTLVYYTSLTGRASDYEWISLSLNEAVRIIRATMLSPDQYDQLQPQLLITACQELGQVYEFGTKSHYKTVPEVFNYLQEANSSLQESAMILLADEAALRGHEALYYHDVTEVYGRILKSLKEVPGSARERNQLISKHFSSNGYSIRVDSLRISVGGKKHRALMQSGKTGVDLRKLTNDEKNHLVAWTTGALK